MVEILGKNYVTEKEACRLLGYSVEWLRKQRRAQTGPAHIRLVPGGKIYYDRTTLENWIRLRIAASI
jgi:hypothetical protein